MERSGTWTEHLTHRRSVFDEIPKAGLTVKARKCQLAMDECVYLRHNIGTLRCPRSQLSKHMSDPVARSPGTFRPHKILPKVHTKLCWHLCTPVRPDKEEPSNQGGVVHLVWRDIPVSETAIMYWPCAEESWFFKEFILQTGTSDHGVGQSSANLMTMAETTQWPISARKFFCGSSIMPRWRRNAWPLSWLYRPSESTCWGEPAWSRLIIVPLSGWTNYVRTTVDSPAEAWPSNHFSVRSSIEVANWRATLTPCQGNSVRHECHRRRRQTCEKLGPLDFIETISFCIVWGNDC